MTTTSGPAAGPRTWLAPPGSHSTTTSSTISRRHPIQLIGINGFKRSGKGETANAIAALRPNVVQVGFADKLKIMAAKALGFVDCDDQTCINLMDVAKECWVIDIQRHRGWQDGKYGDPGRLLSEHVTHITGREYLQHFGNQARHVFGSEFWVDQVLPQPSLHPAGDIRRFAAEDALVERYPGAEFVCITDLRYPNEAQRVRALGGDVVEVIRPDTESDGHASEQPLPRNLVDFQLHNSGDLDHLADEVRAMLVALGC